jgi:hypothetical protein
MVAQPGTVRPRRLATSNFGTNRGGGAGGGAAEAAWYSDPLSSPAGRYRLLELSQRG